MQGGAVSTAKQKTLGVVGCAVGGLEGLRRGLVQPAITQGWQVAVTLTPTAGRWLRESGEAARLEALTKFPVRDEPRLPTEGRPHPPVDCFILAPASANTIAKLALGIMDNQALTQVGEALGTLDTPVIIFPRVNAAHARHPRWQGHLDALRESGACLIYGPEVWPLYEPREASPKRELPWAAALTAANAAVS
ncbi:flavoprotein [Streptacidiphilus monticola]|uniref:Flavoprotein n=1 Tax=Streptacidiphilus monticola TaxID=2161674 RepID=A0ABW1G4H6_9ACTN